MKTKQKIEKCKHEFNEVLTYQGKGTCMKCGNYVSIPKPTQQEKILSWEKDFDKLTTECFSANVKKLKYFTWKYKEEALKSFIRQLLAQSRLEGRREAINQIEKEIIKLQKMINKEGKKEYEGKVIRFDMGTDWLVKSWWKVLKDSI